MTQPQQESLSEEAVKCSQEIQREYYALNLSDESIPIGSSFDGVTDYKLDLVKTANFLYGTEKTKSLPAAAYQFSTSTIRLLYSLKDVTKYFAGLFYLESPNKSLLSDLSELWDIIVDGWYFTSICVAYGDKALELDKKAWEKSGKVHPEYKCKFDNKCRLFRVHKQNGKTFFTSILTKATNIELDKSQYIYLESQDSWINWMIWIWIKSEYIGGLKHVMNLFRSAAKTFTLEINDESSLDNFEQQLHNTKSFISSKSSDNPMESNEINQLELCKLDAPQVVIQNLISYIEVLEKDKGITGRMTTQKADRVSAGEHYSSLKYVSHIEQLMLQQLNSILYKFKQKFCPQIKYLRCRLSSQALAQGVPSSLINKEFINKQNNLHPNPSPTNRDE